MRTAPTMTALVKKVLPMGGFWWQLMNSTGNKLAAHNVTAAQCKQLLAGSCTPTPQFWNKMGLYVVSGGGPPHQGLNEADLRQYTAEFCASSVPCARARALSLSHACPSPPVHLPTVQGPSGRPR